MRVVAGKAVFVSGCISHLLSAVPPLIQVFKDLIMAGEASLRVEKITDGPVYIGGIGMAVFSRNTFMTVLA